MDTKYLLAGNKSGMYIVKNHYAMYLDTTNTFALFSKTEQGDGVYVGGIEERTADIQEQRVLQSILDKPLTLPIQNREKWTVETYLDAMLVRAQKPEFHCELTGPPYLTKLAAEAWEKSGGFISFERYDKEVKYACMAASESVMKYLQNPISIHAVPYYYGNAFKGIKHTCTVGKHTMVVLSQDLSYVSVLCCAKIYD